MEQLKTDLLVIGAGSGGLSVAAGAVQMGASVILLEGGEMGGDCLNYGCVPSKSLLAMGKKALTQDVSYAQAMGHVQQVIDTIAPVDSQERFEGLGVRVIREFGRFVSPKDVEAGPYRIKARRIVIATGSSPMVPLIAGLEDVPYLTNETLWRLQDKPEHLIILGGGPIGLEMAQAHVRLGSKVTVVEAANALGRDDPEMAALVLQRLRAEGVEILAHTSVTNVAQASEGVLVALSDGPSITGSHLLIAAGRVPNTDKLNLAAAGIELDGRNIRVNAQLKTTNRRVYAIGDVTGLMPFTHTAGYHAGVIIRSALFGLPAKAKQGHIPYATYTQPELAQVGLTEAQARDAHGDKLEVARFDIRHNDRAIAEGKAEGLIKVMVVKGRPVGVSIVGDQAGELISLWSMAIANNMTMAQVSAMVAPYPTYAEINKRAAGAYFTPRLFDNPTVKRVVGLVQRLLP
jgi:pyruvate/2-oxoglutarate dehydrogenase complex dihydrolipoamide dehydrogenase (E3) component